MLRSSIGQWLVDFDPWLADYAFVSVALIHERRLGEHSALAPWLRSSLLPERPDVPLLWSAEQQEELKCSTTAPFASRLEEMREDFAWLQENPNPNPAVLALALSLALSSSNPNPNPDPNPKLQENVFDAEPAVFPAAVFSWDAYVEAHAIAFSP